MRRGISPALALCVLLCPQSSLAQNPAFGMQTGNDAYIACQAAEGDKGAKDFTLAIACLSWINGAVQAAEPDSLSRPYKPVYCTPQSGGSTGQYRDVFIKFLRANPEKRHLPAIWLFHQAMAAAFPCR